MKKRSGFKFITTVFICAMLAIGVALPIYGEFVGGEAEAYKTLPSTPSADDNLFLENIGKFNLSALDDLAKVINSSYTIEQLVNNYSTVKTATDFGPTIVALGSYKARDGKQQQLNWIPTYLSKDKSNNVILTLWLAKTEDNNTATSSYQEKSWFSDGTYHLSDTKSYKETSTSTAQNIYSNSYDGSYVRHAMLNADSNYLKAWGWYWSGAQTQTKPGESRVTMPAVADLNKFTILTSGALSNYIVSPKDVTWQMNESGFRSDPSYNGSDKAGYPCNWVNDKIWLPSAGEVITGTLWQTTSAQRVNTVSTYLRSPGTSDKARAAVLVSDTANGYTAGAGRYDYDVGDVQFAIRPALHLNLTSAIANGVRPITAPQDVTTTYNGKAQDVSTLPTADKPAWFDTTKVTLTYATSNMTDVDTYTVTVKLKSTASKEAWRDTGNTDDRTIDFTIDPKELTLKYTKNSDNLYDASIVTSSLAQYDTSPPTDSDLTVTYTKTGSSNVETLPLKTSGNFTVRVKLTGFTNYSISNPTYDFSFTRPKVAVPTISTPNQTYEAQPLAFAVSLDADYVEIDDTDSGAVWTEATQILTATEVDDYTVKAKLKNPAKYDWADGTNGEKDIVFHITKATANVIVTDDSGNTTLTCGRGSTPNLTINTGTLKNDLVKFTIYATKGSDKFLLASNILVDTPGTGGTGKTTTFAINTMALQVGNTYTVLIEYSSPTDEKNGSYNLNFIGSLTLNITQPEKKVNVMWKLAHGDVNDNFAAGEIRHVTYSKSLSYNGTPFVWTVDVPTLMFSDFALDSTYGTNGYQNSEKTDAGTYTTSVRIISNDTKTVVDVFEIEWTVDKALIDLAQMNWKGNGELEFSNSQQTMELENVPSVIKANYGGITKWKDVKDPVGTVSVTSFAFTDPAYADNYYLPLKSDPDTFENTDGAFLWEIEWKIAPKKIRVEWGTQKLTDPQGYFYDVAVLLNEDYRSLVTHTYYEVDQSGNKLNPASPVDINSVTVPKKDIKFYVCELSLASSAGGYELDGDTTSNIFMIGRLETGVVFNLNNASLPYTGKAVALTFTNDGNLLISDYTLEYYLRDGTPLDGVPTDAGKYWVEVVLNDSVTQDYYIASAKDFEFEIAPRQIAENWLENVKPFRLNLSREDVGMIEYRFADANGNPVTFEQMKSQAGKYQIQASIKEEYRSGCAFANGSAFTDWKEFTLSEADLASLEDPNDPNNYGETPIDPGPGSDEPTNPGDDGGNGGGPSFIDKLLASNFPLWQVAVMAVSALLAILFIAKAAQYGSRAKNANAEAKKIKSRAYASLLPIFSTETVALGLSNQIWSIMAFGFAGFAVLMLAVMLINRSRWKKAELAKESAIEDSEQRKVRAAKEEREAEKQERIAFQERMVQAGGTGGDSSLFEQRLLEMEARHREEMDRRDEAMKMMLANLMGGRPQGADGGFAYASMDDTDLLVQRVIAGLLPAMQQMIPEPTAYLAAPQEQNEELIALVEEQKALMEEQRAIVEEQNEEMRNMAEAHSEEMRAMSDQISELQSQLAEAMSHERADAIIMPDNSEDLKAMTDELNALREQIANLGAQPVVVAGSDSADDMKAITDEVNALREQIANLNNQPVTVVAADNGEDMKAMADEMNALRAQVARLSESQLEMSVLDDEDDDFDFDDEEEWDSILDEDDDDNFVESVIIEADGTVRKVSPNFRMRLKESSDKNREWYAAIKNLFCSQKGVTYRVCKRVEKIRYQGNVIAVIGIAKRSIKLWLALKPFEYDARRYHHKDVSDKPRFVDVPLYVRVGSDRALMRAQELILALFQEQAMEARKRYTDRDIQELIFTLKYNKLLTKKGYKQMLAEVMHVHDCDVLDNETAEKCIEAKNVDYIDDSVIETVKLDDIDAKFQDGNRVTLDRLRKLGLVSEDCTGYVVAADKRLTKPLIIVANDFTMDAVKMIVLTGGRVIRLTQINK